MSSIVGFVAARLRGRRTTCRAVSRLSDAPSSRRALCLGSVGPKVGISPDVALRSVLNHNNFNHIFGI